MPEGIEGTNNPFTEAEFNELKSILETEKQARAQAEAKIAEFNGAIAERDSVITSLKATLAQREEALANVNTNLSKAVAAYKALVIQANPSIPSELITGDTIDEINQSLEKAKGIISKVRASIEAEIASGKVPTGAPARTLPDLEALSPREKIQYALTKGGKI